MSEKKLKKKSSKDDKVSRKKKDKTPVSLSLIADDGLDPTLSSLFAVKQPPVKAKRVSAPGNPVIVDVDREDENDAELSELEDDVDLEVMDAEPESDTVAGPNPKAVAAHEAEEEEEEKAGKSKRKRKRKDVDGDLEDKYMSRLAREDEKEAARLATERAAKRQKPDHEEAPPTDGNESEEEREDGVLVNGDIINDEEEEAMSPQPKHETEERADADLEKANRTVFLGNVSTAVIASKTSRKTLMAHLESFFSSIASAKDSSTKPKVESLRFRSTPYASAIPKKAAFAKKELMDATTKSTNAYAVYSSPKLAREAAKRLNGTIVLDRHLRVDEVAHPSKVDHHRCVFVGNLGFVNDESNIQDANEEDGREKRKRGKEPADVEEGLWRTFGKCGKVESVRVIRDSTTRVGKGIAYVQFEDENAVEAALLLNEKKFPPMLPRKLRISRAKAQKRNAKPGSGRPSVSRPGAKSGQYQRKLTGEENSKLGRTGKLLGRAAAAQARKGSQSSAPPPVSKPALGNGIKKPEDFVFEGHRASARSGKSGLKLGGKHAKSKKTKVTKRSASYSTRNKRRHV